MVNKAKKASCRGKYKEIVKTIGLASKHPVIWHDLETITRTKIRKGKQCENKNSLISPTPNVRRLLCFAGIPAAVLSAIGSGTNRLLSEHAAACAFFDKLRLLVGSHIVNRICAVTSINPNGDEINSLLPLFASIEKLICENFLAIGKLGQFEMSQAAQTTGKSVIAHLKNLHNPEGGHRQNEKDHSFFIESEVMNSKTNNADVDVIEQTFARPNEESTSVDADDDVVIIESNAGSSKSPSTLCDKQNPLPNSVTEMRNRDRAIRLTVEERINEIRKKSGEAQLSGSVSPGYSPAESVEFGNRWNSRKRNLIVADQSGPMTYVEADSSDSDGEPTTSKKRKMENGKDEGIILNLTAANKTGLSNKDEEEQVEMIDEWNEDQDVIVLDEEKETKIESDNEISVETVSDEELTTLLKEENELFDGESNLEEMVTKRGWPQNYEKFVIGVIQNKELSLAVEQIVLTVAENGRKSLEKMSEDAWDHFKRNSQNFKIYQKKMDVRKKLIDAIQQIITDRQLSMHVTGSSINGCGSYNSDVDMCLLYPSFGTHGYVFDDFLCDRQKSLKILRKIQHGIKRCHPRSEIRQLIRDIEVVPAKVPIIKLILKPPFDDLDIDINVNNIAGIYNSHLLHYYSQVDGRFPVIALLVKHWAIRNGINDAMSGTLNSYSLILLVVHFLQCGVKPAVLPNLQYIYPDKFDTRLPLSELHLFGPIVEKLPARPPCDWSIGELIVGFFAYYANFQFDKYAISIRSAQAFPRDKLAQANSYYKIFIEEPFDAINTARCVRGQAEYDRIVRAFRKAASKLSKPTFDLRDIDVHL